MIEKLVIGWKWRIEKSVGRLRKISLNDAHNTRATIYHHHVVRKMGFAAQSSANGCIFHLILTAILCKLKFFFLISLGIKGFLTDWLLNESGYLSKRFASAMILSFPPLEE